MITPTPPPVSPVPPAQHPLPRGGTSGVLGDAAAGDVFTSGHGGDPLQALYDGWKLLASAGRVGEWPILSDALLNAADLLRPLGADGRQWVHLAAIRGHADFVRQWIARGLPIDTLTTQGFAPLHFAAAGGHPEVVAVLLQASVQPAAQARGGWTPLDLAVRAQALPVVRLLLAHGASPNAALPPDGYTPLQRAVREGQVEMVQALLAAGADVNAPGGAGTALAEAMQAGNPTLIALLRAHGAEERPTSHVDHANEALARGWLRPWAIFSPAETDHTPPPTVRALGRTLFWLAVALISLIVMVRGCR